jgi:peptidoglycan/xylan/chitin deacetylase (PgdA/CDA1 family)
MASVKQGDAVPILTYHSLDESGSAISMPPAVFRRQMLALKSWGFHGLALGDLLDAWEGKTPLPERPVVLTFDDGFRNLFDCAAPVLDEVDFRATVFVVAGKCGGTNDWTATVAGIPTMPLLTWNELRELSEAGWEIGSHTMNHRSLTEIGEKEAAWEIATARQILEERLGRSVSVFAYPYGHAEETQRRLAQQHYRGACGTVLGESRPRDDRHWLRRIDMYYYRAFSLFRFFPTTICRPYLRLRALGRACRSVLGAASSIGTNACRS